MGLSLSVPIKLYFGIIADRHGPRPLVTTGFVPYRYRNIRRPQFREPYYSRTQNTFVETGISLGILLKSDSGSKLWSRFCYCRCRRAVSRRGLYSLVIWNAILIADNLHFREITNHSEGGQSKKWRLRSIGMNILGFTIWHFTEARVSPEEVPTSSCHASSRRRQTTKNRELGESF